MQGRTLQNHAALKRYLSVPDDCYWAGRVAPFPAVVSTALLEPQNGFREIPQQHGRFRLVCFVEEDVGDFTAWRLILDEMVRLLRPGEQTMMLFSVDPSKLGFTEIASFLKRRTDCSFHFVSRAFGAADIIALSCVRTSRVPQLDSIGFGVIADGRRPDNLRRFVESVLDIEGLAEFQCQIALCGPPMLREQLAQSIPDSTIAQLIFVEEPAEYRKQGWITRKKNLLVECMSAKNLLIVHDRYVIPHDFLKNLINFGVDFDLVVPRQIRQGHRFPDWTATAGDWDTNRTYLLPYGEDSRFLYANGGALLAKRSILAEHGWNELLFWDQSEDVELTRRLVDAGIVPRIAPQLDLEVTDARHGYEQAFERTRQDGTPMPRTKAFPRGGALTCSGLTLSDFAERGLIAWSDQWQASVRGLIATHSPAELALCHIEYMPVLLRIDYSAATSFEVRINETTKKVEHTGANCSIGIALSSTHRAASGQVVVSFIGAVGLAVHALELVDNTEPAVYPITSDFGNPIAGTVLGDGWWPSEAWGTWTKGTRSVLLLPLPKKLGMEDVVLTLELRTLPETRGEQLLGMACNGIPIACVAVTGGGRRRLYEIRIPGEIAAQEAPMEIAMSALRTSSPVGKGAENRDRRQIGIGLSKIDVRLLRKKRTFRGLREWVQGKISAKERAHCL